MFIFSRLIFIRLLQVVQTHGCHNDFPATFALITQVALTYPRWPKVLVEFVYLIISQNGLFVPVSS